MLHIRRRHHGGRLDEEFVARDEPQPRQVHFDPSVRTAGELLADSRQDDRPPSGGQAA